MSEDNNKIVVTETLPSDSYGIDHPVLTGYHITKFREQMIDNGNNAKTVDYIISNAYQSILHYKRTNVQSENEYQKPIKMLCLGKVQSGKTSFFLASICLAFDNGYDVAYVLGGTKLRLKKQNLGRIIETYRNNEKIKILDVNTKNFNEDIASYVNEGYKVILVILKNAAEKSNLGKLKELTIKYPDLPSVVVDDEGDEFTPGAERAKKKNSKAGKTHDKVVEIITTFKICTFLSITATPQANLLVSTFDGISPNRLVLVQPGKGYTGGREFFDTKDNPHVVLITDKDDFVDSIPESFKDALHFFLFACALKRSSGDYKPLSMLVHPSSLNKIQDVVAFRINKYINDTVAVKNNKILYDDLFTEVKKSADDYKKANNIDTVDIQKVISELPAVIDNLLVQTINYSSADYGSDDDENEPIYKIKVGGNMLGRGLTIDRLIVSYIYRDSKESQVDTMYQRCRWFGYK